MNGYTPLPLGTTRISKNKERKNKMACLRCSHFHRSTALTASTTDLLVTVTNSTNIADEDKFCFVLCQNPSTVMATAPVPVQMTVNGENIPVYNKFGKELNSHTLANYYRRGIMKGYYVVNGTDNYLIFSEVPKCKCME